MSRPRNPQHATPWLVLVAGLVTTACTEKLVAPGPCPDFCPPGLTTRDTVLRTALGRDSAFRGYWRPHEVIELLVTNQPSVRSYALSRSGTIPHTRQFGSDTTPNPIVGVDSVMMTVTVFRRDTAAHNLRLHFFRISKTFDSTATFADADQWLTDSLVRSVNVDSLIALPGRRDPTTRDSVFVDTVGTAIRLLLQFDSAQAPYLQADSGVLAFGIAVSADTPTTVRLGASHAGGRGAGIFTTWFLRVDSLGADTIPWTPAPLAGTTFDTFVFGPPAAAVDSTLVVGGMPAARSLLRVDLPPGIRDSSQVIRATLLLVPDVAAAGAPADSFVLAAVRVDADLGAKSILGDFLRDSSNVALAWISIGSTDTVRIEMTRMVRAWTADTTRPAAFMLLQSTEPSRIIEGNSFAEIRFKPSGDTAFRPTLHVTYAPRFRFEVP